MYSPPAVPRDASALAPNTAVLPLETLKKRADFLRVNQQGTKFVTSSVILLMLKDESNCAAVQVRVGYTVTKKLGGAVQRNRIKRRLREAVRMVFPARAQPGHIYVLIARHSALHCPFGTLLRDLEFALPRIGRIAPKPKTPTS